MRNSCKIKGNDEDHLFYTPFIKHKGEDVQPNEKANSWWRCRQYLLRGVSKYKEGCWPFLLTHTDTKHNPLSASKQRDPDLAGICTFFFFKLGIKQEDEVNGGLIWSENVGIRLLPYYRGYTTGTWEKEGGEAST